MVKCLDLTSLVFRDLLHRLDSLVDARNNFIEGLLRLFHLTFGFINRLAAFKLFTLQSLILNVDFIVLLFDINKCGDEFVLLLLQNRRFVSKLGTVCLNLRHAFLQLPKTFVISLLNLNDVILTFIEETSEGAECANKEHRGEVQNVLKLFNVAFAHFIYCQVHKTHSFENFGVEILLSLLVVVVLFFGNFGFSHSLIDLIIVSLYEHSLSYLL